MTRPAPHEPESDLGQVIDDVEQIAPLAVLLASALIGIAASGGFHLVIFPSASVELALWLSTLVPWK